MRSLIFQTFAKVDCPANDGCLISYGESSKVEIAEMMTFSETTADGNLFVRDCADAHAGGQVRAISIYGSHSR